MNSNHQRTKRVGRRQVAATLASPDSEPEQVVHDRRAANDNLPLNARIAPIEIDDPYAPAGEPGKILAVRSLRDDPLGWLHSHRRINEAQFGAGRCWQRDYEESQIGHVRTNLPRGPRVDGGRVQEPLTVAMLAYLLRVRRRTGMTAFLRHNRRCHRSCISGCRSNQCNDQ